MPACPVLTSLCTCMCDCSVVSGLNREIKSLVGSNIPGGIQTDAAINPGACACLWGSSILEQVTAASKNPYTTVYRYRYRILTTFLVHDLQPYRRQQRRATARQRREARGHVGAGPLYRA